MVKVQIVQGNKSKVIESDCNTVLQLFQQQKISMNAPCGGNGTCGKCLVNVNGQMVQACKTQLQKNMVIYLPNQKTIGVNLDREIEVALDLGTTTICLVIFENRNELARCSINNPLSSFGSDVISRIQHIQKNEVNLKIQQRMLCEKVFETVCEYGRVKKMVVSGNTIMQHIFAGISPVTIATYPFVAPTLFKEIQRYDIPLFENCDICFMPCVASYVGGDSISGVIDSELYKNEENSLLLDIGTNGEIILKYNNQMMSCSVAAGPAFEGAQLSCGSNDIDQCITHFNFDSQLSYDHNHPKGISGSGYLDLLACFLRKGIVEETGRLLDKDELTDYQGFIDEDENGCPIFKITNELYINNKDIRNLQMAISATSSAIATILSKKGCDVDDINKVYFSGNFGSHLDLDSIVDIGLIPKEWKDKVIFTLNSSLNGAVKVLKNEELLARARELSDSIEYIELSNDNLFKEIYMDHMYLTKEKIWSYNSH